MRRVLMMTGLSILLFFAVGCTKELSEKVREAAQKSIDKEIVIPIRAGYPRRGDISAYFETTTRILAENRVEVIAQGVGECVAVHVKEGDRVEKGQVLAELDKEEALAALRQLEVQVAQSKASYEVAQQSYAEGLGAKVERDNARYAYEQAKASLEAQRLKVDNLTIRAPITGVATRKTIQKGQMVAASMPVFSIVDPESYMLVINPPEKELPRLEIGQEAEVKVDAVRGEDFEARVRRINPAVDPATGTIKVVLDIDEEIREQLPSGAFARVRLVMETHEDALLVDKDVIVEESGRKYVFVVKEKEDAEYKGESEKSEESTGRDDEQESAGADRPGDQAEAEAEAAVVDETGVRESGEAEPSQDGRKMAAEEKQDDTETQPEPDADESESDKMPLEGSDKELIAERVEVETGLEDSDSVEILSGIDDDTLLVTLGQHTLKPGTRIKITRAESQIDAKAGMTPKQALKAARQDEDEGEN